MERGRTAFDHWMHRHYFTFRDLRDRNISVQCNLCLPKINILSTARDSTSNLKKHLEVHLRVFSILISKYCCLTP